MKHNVCQQQSSEIVMATMPAILIADSGSTKTDWLLACNNGIQRKMHTDGINPARDARDIIYNVICRQLLPQLPHDIEPQDIYFYGAGCIPPFSDNVRSVLHELFSHCSIEVESDLLGAVRALCGNTPGIACILGTGSNSCFYDGKNILQHTPPLGYILGDEGSGAYLGKTLAGNLFKDMLPDRLKQEFCNRFGLQMEDVIARVYRQPGANTFLASLVPFIANHRSEPAIHDMLVEAFRLFFKRNIRAYNHPEMPVHCVGSIAHQFETELKEAATAENMKIGQIVRHPIERMAKFHLQAQQMA